MARGGGGAAEEEEEEEEGMAVSETLTAESEECRRGSSSSASSVAASSDSYCPPDEWQQVAIKTCVTDDAVAAMGKPKPPAPGKDNPPVAEPERHRAPGSCCYKTYSLLAFVRSSSQSGLVDRAAGEFGWLQRWS